MSQPAPGFEKHPDHEVDISPSKAHIRVTVADTVVAETDDAVSVLETGHRPVHYLPWTSLDEKLLTKTDTRTYCPFKGHASYWSITVGDTTVKDALWRYEDPFEECLTLKDYVAFYTDRVEFEVDGVAQSEGPGWVKD